MAPGGAAYGCGQCMPCRINSRRTWTHRIMLETTQHPENSFWTLTYTDENIPLTEAKIPTLEPLHLTQFMKRLRHHTNPSKVRYFNVGEYGEQTSRPHYHLALFNFPACERGNTSINRRGNCCSVCDLIRDVWGQGRVHSGNLETASAAYICGYITKKMTRKEDIRLCGRNPEFARMSLKPGIGAGIMPEVASALLSHNLEQLPDVPTSLRSQSRVQPLGRYLTRTLRAQIGMPPNAPQATIEKRKAEMLPVQEMARKIAPKGLYLPTLKTLLVEANEGKYQQQLARSRIYKKRDIL